MDLRSRDRRKFPPLFRGHWQSPCTALTAGKCLPLGLCRQTVKEARCYIAQIIDVSWKWKWYAAGTLVIFHWILPFRCILTALLTDVLRSNAASSDNNWHKQNVVTNFEYFCFWNNVNYCIFTFVEPFLCALQRRPVIVMPSQVTCNHIVCLTFCSGNNKEKHFTSLAFFDVNPRVTGPVDSSLKRTGNRGSVSMSSRGTLFAKWYRQVLFYQQLTWVLSSWFYLMVNFYTDINTDFYTDIYTDTNIKNGKIASKLVRFLSFTLRQWITLKRLGGTHWVFIRISLEFWPQSVYPASSSMIFLENKKNV